MISAKKQCFLNYISKGFLLDLIGALPVYQIAQLFLTQNISVDNCLLMNTICRFAHIYILFAYFEYISDLPTVNIAYLMVSISSFFCWFLKIFLCRKGLTDPQSVMHKSPRLEQKMMDHRHGPHGYSMPNILLCCFLKQSYKTTFSLIVTVGTKLNLTILFWCCRNSLATNAL